MHNLAANVASAKALTGDETVRQRAWDNAVHAEATRFVFDRRAKILGSWITLRDLTCIGIPLTIGYIYGSEQFEAVKPYKNYAVALLAFLALLQLLLTVFSLLKQWDKELSYDLRSVRDQYALRVKWSKIGDGQSLDIARDYEYTIKQQEEYESHDAEKGITDREKLLGHRAGLLFFRRKCACGIIPKTLDPPIFVRHRCPHCGSPQGV